MLKKRIKEDVSEAAKKGDQTALLVLRLLSAAILSKEKEKRYKITKDNPEIKESDIDKESALTDEETLEIVSSEAKKRRESISAFEKGNRQELADKEKEELDILMKYMPEQMGEEELVALAKEAISKTGAKEIKDMGKVMAELIPKIKGRADSSQVSKIVKEALSS